MKIEITNAKVAIAVAIGIGLVILVSFHADAFVALIMKSVVTRS